MPPGGTLFLYVAAVNVLMHVLPRLWASNHPDHPMSRAIMATIG